MKLFRYAVAVVVVLIAIAVGVRYFVHQHDRTLALPVISELGGSVGSIPTEPFGTSYYIAFRNRKFSRSDLGRLAALRPLSRRNPVSIKFVDSNLSAEDMNYLVQLLPEAKIFQSSATDSQ